MFMQQISIYSQVSDGVKKPIPVTVTIMRQKNEIDCLYDIQRHCTENDHYIYIYIFPIYIYESWSLNPLLNIVLKWPTVV